MKIKTSCKHCETPFTFVVNGDDFRAWKAGRAIQLSLPYLCSEQRELLLSQRCLPCFERDDNDISEFLLDDEQ